jgi:hypothetical protein
MDFTAKQHPPMAHLRTEQLLYDLAHIIGEDI